MATTTYKDAGVDLDLYRESMSRISGWARSTFSPRVIPSSGGFAGLFQLDFDGALFRRQYRNPVLIACTDGVGTKLKVATAVGTHSTIGVDLVAMCVNDAICCGAETLFFLDYVAMSKDHPELLEEIVAGVSIGCRQADCALLGGETAIMPALYPDGEYDVAGFCVGVVERDRLIDGHTIVPGDCVLGIASSGIHSNGYSLVRKVVFETAGLQVTDRIESLGQTVGETLLEPTRIYARPIREIMNHYKVKNVVHGIAHITGGGLLENLSRIVPDGVEVLIDRQSWETPAVFPWLQNLGGINPEEMDRVFNMGIGLILVISPYYVNAIQKILKTHELKSWQIGSVVAGKRRVAWR